MTYSPARRYICGTVYRAAYPNSVSATCRERSTIEAIPQLASDFRFGAIVITVALPKPA